ncbi:hypothetical protein BPO_1323 [Bergeyella porcorum]|uniref:Uncharacterized protein n=1 Tax=Bergeyella porcorum TaxID=1735111 RepID=A0AAU0F2L2_9FLAO
MGNKLKFINHEDRQKEKANLKINRIVCTFAI